MQKIKTVESDTSCWEDQHNAATSQRKLLFDTEKEWLKITRPEVMRKRGKSFPFLQINSEVQHHTKP